MWPWANDQIFLSLSFLDCDRKVVASFGEDRSVNFPIYFASQVERQLSHHICYSAFYLSLSNVHSWFHPFIVFSSYSSVSLIGGILGSHNALVLKIEADSYQQGNCNCRHGWSPVTEISTVRGFLYQECKRRKFCVIGGKIQTLEWVGLRFLS